MSTDLGPAPEKGARAITELLEPRQKCWFQGDEEPTRHQKGLASRQPHASPGRFLVLRPYGQGVSISRRINGENERQPAALPLGV